MAIRRKIRERKEFLYRKSLEGEDKLNFEKKKRIREAMENNTPIPTELKDDSGLF